jgi:hypothetical protein
MKKKKNYKKPNWFVYLLFKLITKFLAKFVFNLKVTRNEMKNKIDYLMSRCLTIPSKILVNL